MAATTTVVAVGAAETAAGVTVAGGILLSCGFIENFCSSARMRVHVKSKGTRSLMSSELSMTTTRPRLVRWISGMAVSSSLLRCM